MTESSEGPTRAVDKRTVFFSIEGESTVLTAECGSVERIADVLDALGRANGRQDLHSFMISLEDADDRTVATVTVQEALRGNRHGRIHLHFCHHIRVIVEYNAKSLTHEFSPASTVHRVLARAVGSGGFSVESDAHDLTLQVTGTTVPLAPNVHIGTLVREKRCDLSLELVPKDRHQG